MEQNKKVVVFGGGTGISYILKGLKEFPIDITAVITVADNGRSTGKLREEFNIPAVGDIRQVITNLSNASDDIRKLLSYRFDTNNDFNGHALGNLMLVADLKINGSLTKAIENLSELLGVKHKIYPISEDNLTLMAKTESGFVLEGEENITACPEKKEIIYYKNEPKVTEEALKAVEDADLIVLSVGSLYTSVLPNIICKEMQESLKKTKAKILYVCNAMTQPGETDGFKVSDHIKLLNKFLPEKKVDAVIASTSIVDNDIIERYHRKEEKELVLIDEKEIKKTGAKLIAADLLMLDEDNTLKHNSILLASLIFSYMMRNEYVVRY